MKDHQTTKKQSQRNNLKQNSLSLLSSSTRRTQHRQTIQNQIRKQKKNTLVQLKRQRQRVLHPQTQLPLAISSSSDNKITTQQNDVAFFHENESFHSLCFQLIQGQQGVQAQVSESLAKLLTFFLSQRQQTHSTRQTYLEDILFFSQFQPNNNNNEIDQQQQKEQKQMMALKFIETLSDIIISTSTSTVTYQDKLNAIQILNNLAALSIESDYTKTEQQQQQQQQRNQDNSYNENYYGNYTKTLDCFIENSNCGWCGIMAFSYQKTILSSILESIISFFSREVRNCFVTTQSITSSFLLLFNNPEFEKKLTLCIEACWCLGNLAGDSQHVRSILIHGTSSCNDTSSILVKELIELMRVSFHLRNQLYNNNEKNTSFISIQNLIYELCRNVSWTMSNLSRGSNTSAHIFLCSNGSSGRDGRLTAKDFITFLSSPLDKSLLNTSSNNTIINEEITTEILWLLAFLTAREHEAVENLVFTKDEERNNPNIHHDLSHTLLQILFTIVNQIIILSSSSSSTSESSTSLSKMFIPCARTIANICTSCNGKFVPNFLFSDQSNDVNITFVLSKLLNHFSNNNCNNNYDNRDLNSLVLTEAIWTANSIFVGFGEYHLNNNNMLHNTSSHHVIFSSIETLMNSLSTLLSSSSNNNNNNIILYIPKKDITCALWSAIQLSVINLSSFINDNLTNNSLLLSTLVNLLKVSNSNSYYDIETIFFSLRIINFLVRYSADHNNEGHGMHSRLVHTLDKMGIEQILEDICDLPQTPSSSSSRGNYMEREEEDYLSMSTEIAADLIDDFFSVDAHDEMEASYYQYNQQTTLTTQQGHEVFSFGLGSDNQSNNSIPFDFSSGGGVSARNVVSNNNINDNVMGRGRGRGRGMSNTPAWMQAKERL